MLHAFWAAVWIGLLIWVLKVRFKIDMSDGAGLITGIILSALSLAFEIFFIFKALVQLSRLFGVA